MIPKPKTIAVVARFYGEAGPGRYVKNVLKHLEQLDSVHKYVVFVREKGSRLYSVSSGNFSKVLAEFPWYSWSEQFGFLLKILRFKPNLLYVPHFNIPVFYPGRLVTAIPDIIMHSFSTEGGTTLPKFYFRFKKFMYKLVISWAVFRSFKVIVPTNEVKKEFLRTFTFTKESKYVVAYEGVDEDFLVSSTDINELKKRIGITGDYILHVGSMYSHKNVDKLLEAFSDVLDKKHSDLQLVLVGKKDKYSWLVSQKVEELGLSGKVLLPGESFYVSDTEVVALRKNALFCVFPSLKEGFSLTPLESQAVGLACAISDIPVHREVYGDSVLYLNPNDRNDISAKISQLLVDPNLVKTLVEKGTKKVQEYSWTSTAAKTLEVLEEALKKS